MKEIEQLPSADVLHKMFVLVGAATERAVVVPEPSGKLRVGMLHGVVTGVTINCYRYQASNISGS